MANTFKEASVYFFFNKLPASTKLIPTKNKTPIAINRGSGELRDAPTGEFVTVLDTERVGEANTVGVGVRVGRRVAVGMRVGVDVSVGVGVGSGPLILIFSPG